MKNILKNALNLPVSRQALTILRSGTLIILAQLGYILFDAFFRYHTNQLYVLTLYQKCMEYVFLEVVIVVIGAFLFDMTVRETEDLQ